MTKGPSSSNYSKNLYYYEQNRKKSNFSVRQLLDATCFSVKYSLKFTYHLDMFKKRIESKFNITDVKKDGKCWFASVMSGLKKSQYL